MEVDSPPTEKKDKVPQEEESKTLMIDTGVNEVPKDPDSVENDFW